MENKNPAKILVVDDSSVNNFLLENVLEEKGYHLQVAYNGKEALVFISEDPPDIILLDIMMPGIDGFEILDKLSQEESKQKIPVIMVTSKNEDTDKERAFKSGAVEYIVKPIDIEELLAKVEKTLEKISSI